MSAHSPKKRVLIINAYFDDLRSQRARPNKVPQSMGPVFLAGYFSPQHWDITLWNEQAHGPLDQAKAFENLDALVLTGLNNAFDRMKQLTAYAKTKSPKCVVIAGGSAVRVLPKLSQEFFDIVSLGDAGDIKRIINSEWGVDHTNPDPMPRYDLCNWMRHVGYVESSQNCNFSCSFCSLTAEGGHFQNYSLEFIKRQIKAIGKNKAIIFLDNNFFGNDSKFFDQKIDLLGELHDEGYLPYWSCLVSSDFFYDRTRIKRVKEVGCTALFSGVESFDTKWLKSIHKNQNTHESQIDQIRDCLEEGMVYFYGFVMDFVKRSIHDIQNELAYIFEDSSISLPTYFTTIVPMLGTPYFYELLNDDKLLPNAKLRDFDPTTLTIKPKDPLPQVAHFLKNTQNMKGFRKKIFKHSQAFAKRYLKGFDRYQKLLFLHSVTQLMVQNTPNDLSFFKDLFTKKTERTHISTTEFSAKEFSPAFPIHPQYAHYFKPTFITDECGQLTSEVAPDLKKESAKLRRVV
ncbi:MAG: radical SAM protein [Deltaproteobacteria bacterium]|nr:radical SAM protein [Deltaproteobacteria bacterium]